MTHQIINELFAALQSVSDVLSKVSDAEWSQVEEIQSRVNQSQEIANQLQVRP